MAYDGSGSMKDYYTKKLAEYCYNLWETTVKELGTENETTAKYYMQAVQHYLDAGCYEEVVKYGPRGLETCIKMYGPNNDWSAAYAFFITEALYHLRRFDEALKQAQYAYSICLNLYGEKHHG